MANFKYAKHTAGMTLAMLELPANGAVEIGELVDSTLAPALAADSSVKFLAMSDADDAADVLLLPLLNGTVLKGTVDDDGGISEGDSVGISDTQELDANASNALFIALEDGGAGDEINVLLMAGL